MLQYLPKEAAGLPQKTAKTLLRKHLATERRERPRTATRLSPVQCTTRVVIITKPQNDCPLLFNSGHAVCHPPDTQFHPGRYNLKSTILSPGGCNTMSNTVWYPLVYMWRRYLYPRNIILARVCVEWWGVSWVWLWGQYQEYPTTWVCNPKILIT